MKYDAIESMEQLRKLYDLPMELAVKKQKSQLDQYSTQFLELSAFCVLSTCSAGGSMDCSPRGDYPGFIKVLDDDTIAIPDRPGNNRLDSLSNVIENSQVGLLILVPGFKECLRINGQAKLFTQIDLLKKFEHKGKLPRTVMVISIQEIYFHCAKAITRSKLWQLDSQVDRKIMPSLGKILMKQVDPEKSADEIRKVEAFIEERVKTTLY